MKTLETMLMIAGVMQLGLLLAGGTMPRAVQLKKHLAPLPPFISRLVWVYFGFIGFVLIGFGTLTLLHADKMASGEPFARTFCAFAGIFWLIRLIVAAVVFDVRPYLTSRFLRFGYWLTNVIFVYLPVVYGWAAMKVGA